MKKIFLSIVIPAILLACNEGSNNAKSEAHTHHEIPGVESSPGLNKGSKWKADAITQHNVVSLKTISDNFSVKPFPLVNDYQVLGNDLNTGINKMIQECKMKGADHEALHKWLEPVLEEVNDLKSTSDTAVARATFKSIDSRIDAYFKYFD